MEKCAGSCDQLQQYFIIKRSIDLPPKVHIIFNILEKVIETPYQCQNNRQQSKTFLTEFSKLAIDEQAKFLFENIKYVVKIIFKQQDEVAIKTNQIRRIETTVQVYSTMLRIPIWIQCTFKMDLNKKHVILSNKKKSDTIDLNHYLVRKSKKFKGCIVLENIDNAVKNQMRKYTLSFSETIGEQIYRQLFNAFLEIKQRELQKLMIGGNEIESQKIYSGSKNNLSFLSPKNLNQFISYKDWVQKYLATSKLDLKLISNPDRPYKIWQDQKAQKIFKFEADLKIEVKITKQNFIKNFGNRKNKLIIYSQILQTFSSRYSAVYEKYLFSNKSKLHELITIREENLLEEQDVLFVKGIDLLLIKLFLQFLLVKIKPIPPNSSKITIICSMMLDDHISIEHIKLYLYTLYQNAFLKKSEKLIQGNSLKVIQEEEEDPKDEFQSIEDQQELKDQFKTVLCKNDDFFQFIQGEEQTKNEPIEIFEKSLNQKISTNYLNHRYKLKPIQPYNKQKNLMASHYLWEDWVRRKQGGVICVNDTIVNSQKKMFKQIISAMGNKILKGQSNVLNISLPVVIFKKQSHLQSIARDFCYAPLLLERVTDPLQRVKFATILAISVGTLGISMQKPFNPLLGQTLQAWIGGCPIYLEQISHNPPIGSYYFVGRGYRIHGQIQPKISLGMNNIKGYSEKPNYLIFDDGTIIEMIYGKMVIHGMLFGERQFNFQGKIYVYNKTDNIFSQIIYGPRKKGLLIKPSEPFDFCSGKIYKVKQQFKQKFQNSKQKILPSKQYIEEELSLFQGVWNQIITFDGVQYINFKTQLPCALTSDHYPLPSHSKYRKDLIQLIKGNLQESQKEKEIMEEIQRRDRKLREQWAHQRKIKSQRETKLLNKKVVEVQA